MLIGHCHPQFETAKVPRTAVVLKSLAMRLPSAAVSQVWWISSSMHKLANQSAKWLESGGRIVLFTGTILSAELWRAALWMRGSVTATIAIDGDNAHGDVEEPNVHH